MADNGGGFQLDNYVEVHERIKAFYEKHSEGSLQGDWDTVEVGGDTFIVYRARAYRDAEDKRPAVGMAWEPFPGKTPYTKDSELMNAETSAWGRAIAALGFEVHKGIASAQEVRNRSGGKSHDSPPTDKQLQFVERLSKGLGADVNDQELLKAWGLALGRQTTSKLIDGLNQGTKVEKEQRLTESLEKAREWDLKANPELPFEAEAPA